VFHMCHTPKASRKPLIIKGASLILRVDFRKGFTLQMFSFYCLVPLVDTPLPPPPPYLDLKQNHPQSSEAGRCECVMCAYVCV